jgi:hypothetical protein
MSNPAFGAIADWKGQKYELIGFKTKTIELHVWRSRCPDCGSEFEFSAGTGELRYPTRRCVGCRKRGPGKTSKTQKANAPHRRNSMRGV